MARFLGLVALVLSLVVATVATGFWLSSATTEALRIYRFESEPPETLTRLRADVVDTVGFGPWERDVAASWQIGRVRIVDQGASPGVRDSAWILAGDWGAHYEEDPAPEGTWRPFAAAATAAALVATALILLLSLAIRALIAQGSFTVFGQRDSDAARKNLPGSGVQARMGGHSPPYVPHNPDWDPDRRIR